MIFRQSKLSALILIVSAVCILLKLFISFLFPYSRLLLWFLLLPALFICLIIFTIRSRKILKEKRVFLCLLISLTAVIFALLPIDRELELARFHVFKGFYYSVTQEAHSDIASSEDTLRGRYYLKFPQFLLNPVYRYVDYYKEGDSVAIVFPASESLSVERYYVWLSDSKARDLLEHPQYYGGDMDGFDRIEELDGTQWVYAFTWGDEMPPVDPNL